VNGRTVHLAYLSRLVLAMAYYAGVGGALFVQSLSVKVGVMATCVLMVGPARMRWHFPCIASLFGLWLGAADYGRAYAASTWFCMTAIILSSVYIFEHVLGGADYASLSRLARPRYRARVATTGFYVFKILPELHSRLVRIVEGFRVYGSRKNAGRSGCRQPGRYRSGATAGLTAPCSSAFPERGRWLRVPPCPACT